MQKCATYLQRRGKHQNEFIPSGMNLRDCRIGQKEASNLDFHICDRNHKCIMHNDSISTHTNAHTLVHIESSFHEEVS